MQIVRHGDHAPLLPHEQLKLLAERLGNVSFHLSCALFSLHSFKKMAAIDCGQKAPALKGGGADAGGRSCAVYPVHSHRSFLNDALGGFLLRISGEIHPRDCRALFNAYQPRKLGRAYLPNVVR